MRAVTLASIRAHLPRLVASTLAIVIAVAFVVATLVLSQTTRSTVLQAVGAAYVNSAVVVSSEDGSSVLDVLEKVTALDGVRAVDPLWETSVQTVVAGRTGAAYLSVQAVAEDQALRWQQLAEGSLPQGLGEVAVSDRVGAEVGDVLLVTTYDAEGVGTTTDATVTGVVDLGGDPSAGLYGRAFTTVAQAKAWGASDPFELRVAATDGTDPASLASEVGDALVGGAVSVRTGTQEAEALAAAMTGDTRWLTAILLVFATVALLVAGLVIANTFAVLLAQRTRDLALLRCVGATSVQVRRSVLAEAVMTGFTASLLGVLAGIGLSAGVSALVAATESPVPLSGLSVPPWAVLVGLLVGTLTTLVAALPPARAATQVAPLAALRPVDAAPVRSRPGVARLAAGLLLVGIGTAFMTRGATRSDVLFALPGGVLSFLGVVLLAQRAVPPVAAAAGRLLSRFGGVPGRLAAGNATRNPRRTAATATALLIGVTLTTAMVVGAASTRATAKEGLAAAYPTDVVINGGGGGQLLPPSLLGQLASLDGVVAATALTGAQLTGPDGEPTPAAGVDATEALAVLRSTADLRLPEPGEIVLPVWARKIWDVPVGNPVTLNVGDRSQTFITVAGETDVPLMTVLDLNGLAPDAAVDTLWLRLGDDADQNAAIDSITDLAGAAVPTAFVTGLASERAGIDSVVDVLLLIVTGLLGVAVVIALIGVGNTLALSVIERRQESGLLRALGLTRGQLRRLLAWEAVLVAGVAAVLGVALGVAYGLIGAASVLGGLGEIVLSVPWLQVAVIILVATGAGLLASILPARRAARTPPVAAIAG